MSAMGHQSFQEAVFSEEDDDGSGNPGDDNHDPDYISNNNGSYSSIIRTRDHCDCGVALTSVSNKCIQVTGLCDQQPVRILGHASKGRIVNPKYLQAMSLLMAECTSAPEAVKAAPIIDTVVWNQERFFTTAA